MIPQTVSHMLHILYPNDIIVVLQTTGHERMGVPLKTSELQNWTRSHGWLDTAVVCGMLVFLTVSLFLPERKQVNQLFYATVMLPVLLVSLRIPWKKYLSDWPFALLLCFAIYMACTYFWCDQPLKYSKYPFFCVIFAIAIYYIIDRELVTWKRLYTIVAWAVVCYAGYLLATYKSHLEGSRLVGAGLFRGPNALGSLFTHFALFFIISFTQAPKRGVWNLAGACPLLVAMGLTNSRAALLAFAAALFAYGLYCCRSWKFKLGIAAVSCVLAIGMATGISRYLITRGHSVPRNQWTKLSYLISVPESKNTVTPVIIGGGNDLEVRNLKVNSKIQGDFASPLDHNSEFRLSPVTSENGLRLDYSIRTSNPVLSEQIGVRTDTGEWIAPYPRLRLLQRWHIADIRQKIWNTVLVSIGERWHCGWGLDTESYISIGGKPYDHAHNLFLGITYRGGLLAAAALVAICGAGIRRARTRAALLVPLAASLVYCCVEESCFLTRPSRLTLIVWLPLVLALLAQARPRPKPQGCPSE